MGGGVIQLVAYGAQDIYLTGNPQITFFKSIYKRYTNFSMESIQQTFNGTSIEQVFQNQNKNINDYSVDLQKHLNTDGNYIVAEWVKENI